MLVNVKNFSKSDWKKYVGTKVLLNHSNILQSVKNSTKLKNSYSSRHRSCSLRKGVLRNLQNSQENICARASFNKIAILILLKRCNFIKKIL